MPIIYIAGIRPSVGSTTLTVGMAHAWRTAGRTVRAVKPFLSAPDDRGAAGLDDLDIHIQEPTTASMTTSGSRSDLALEAKRIIGLSQAAEVVLVDGLPLTDEAGNRTNSVEFAKALGASIIGVTDPASPQQFTEIVEAFQTSLIGCVENRVAVYGSSQGIGHIPADRTLLAPSIGQISTALRARLWAGSDSGEALVEHFLIGALVTEWGGNYFGRLQNQGVIVRGGRIDIQMSALNFPLACLILTGCDSPSQYVLQRAKGLEAPLMVTDMNTRQAIAAVETLIGVGKIHCAEKIDRATSLVSRGLDWQHIETAVGL